MMPNVLSEGRVEIWRARLAAPQEEKVKFYWPYLSNDEKSRADRFHFQQHRDFFICCRGIFRTLLGNYLKLAPTAIEFAYTQHGKPYLADPKLNSQILFNLSHSEDYVLYAFAKPGIELGIDIQYRKQLDYDGIAERFFSAYEYNQFLQIPAEERAEFFFKIWVCKEAFIKAIGEGLHCALSSFDVEIMQNSARFSRIANIQQDALAEWSLKLFNLEKSYSAALATSKRMSDIEILEFS